MKSKALLVKINFNLNLGIFFLTFIVSGLYSLVSIKSKIMRYHCLCKLFVFSLIALYSDLRWHFFKLHIRVQKRFGAFFMSLLIVSAIHCSFSDMIKLLFCGLQERLGARFLKEILGKWIPITESPLDKF